MADGVRPLEEVLAVLDCSAQFCGMPGRYPILDSMIRQVEANAAAEPDNVAALAAMLRLVIASDADPYILVGVLIEGLAEAIVQRIPAEKQGDVGLQSMRLLLQQLKAYRVV